MEAPLGIFCNFQLVNVHCGFERGGCNPAGADPEFWERGGLINIFTTGGGFGRGRAPPVTAKGSGGALIAPPVGSGAKPQPLSCFCVYLA